VFSIDTLESLDGIEVTQGDRECIREDLEDRRARELEIKFQEATLKRVHVQVVQQFGLGDHRHHVFPHRTPQRMLTSAIR